MDFIQIVIYIPFICSLVAGYFSAKMDVYQYSRYSNTWWEEYKQTTKEEWYRGNNQKFNPSFPWTADFWHRAKHFQELWLTGAIVIASLSTLSWYWFIFCYYLHGLSFSWFYHYVFEIPSYGGFLIFLKRHFTFTNFS